MFKKIIIVFLILIINCAANANILLKMNENNAQVSALSGSAISFANIISENPASFSGIEKNYISFTNNNYLTDISVMSFKYAAYIDKLKGVINTGYIIFDSGKIRKTFITGSTSFLDAGTTDINEKMFILGYSTNIKLLSLGVNTKFINSDFAGVSDKSLAIDFGFNYNFEFLKDNFTIGGVIKNLGNSFKYDREKYSVPLQYKFGVSASSDFLATGYMIKFGIETIYDKYNHFDGAAGCEIDYKEKIFLRAGYNTTSDQGNGISAGIGLSWSGLKFDYGWTPYSSLGDAHYITLSYSF